LLVPEVLLDVPEVVDVPCEEAVLLPLALGKLGTKVPDAGKLARQDEMAELTPELDVGAFALTVRLFEKLHAVAVWFWNS